MRLVIAVTGVLEQPGRAVLLETAEPLADGGDGGGEEPRSGLDAALFGAFDKSKTMVVTVFDVTHQIEIAGGGHAPILTVARGPAPPPSAGPRTPNPNTNPTPSPASDSYTSIPLGGYDDPFLCQELANMADLAITSQPGS